jgi:hypothetical protein
MVYAKEVREWAALMQGNIATQEALRARNNQTGGGPGSTLRALMVELHTPGQPAQPASPTNAIAEKLWNDVERESTKMRTALPIIMDVESETIPELHVEDKSK